MEMRPEVARTLLDLAEAAGAGGDPAACAASLREAHALFTSFGIAREVSRAATLAQALGLTISGGGDNP